MKTFIVGNEPNQPRFWRPQFDDERRSRRRPPAFGPVLAAAYDALKAVDRPIQVVGVGLSPRGNDRPDATSNVSTLARPLPDGARRLVPRERPDHAADGRAQLPPVPERQHGSARRTATAGRTPASPNADRLKQALWDAFSGTSQPTVRLGPEALSRRARLAGRHERRTAPTPASENVPVTTEANQAAIYGQIPRLVACDPAVAAVNIFGFFDESDRGAGFQAGPLPQGRHASAVAGLVQRRDRRGLHAAARSPGRRPTGVVGAGAKFNDSSPKPAKQTAWNTSVTASEDASARIGLFKVKNQTGSRCAPGRVDVLQVFSGKGSATQERIIDGEFAVKAGYTPLLQLDKRALASGVLLLRGCPEAAMNLDRQSTFLSKGFLAGPAAKPAPVAKKAASKAARRRRRSPSSRRRR